MVRRYRLFTGLLLLALAWILIACPTSLAETGEEPARPPGPDLTGAVPTEDDLSIAGPSDPVIRPRLIVPAVGAEHVRHRDAVGDVSVHSALARMAVLVS